MIINGDTFQFESSGRSFSTHGSSGISLSDDGDARYGYDGYVEFYNTDGQFVVNERELSAEEKKELATYVINQWKAWAGIE